MTLQTIIDLSRLRSELTWPFDLALCPLTFALRTDVRHGGQTCRTRKGKGRERRERREQRAPPRERAARVGRAYSSTTVACRAPSASSRWRTLNATASVKLDPSTTHAAVGLTQ